VNILRKAISRIKALGRKAPLPPDEHDPHAMPPLVRHRGMANPHIGDGAWDVEQDRAEKDRKP
jgi:hypothetical protein